tara:strand:+ start:377 stop:1033 length:657 start_codon:yes stop_codon:yes gene_type:complete
MEDKHQILELFPTPVFVDTIPLGFENLIPSFDSHEMVDNRNNDARIDTLNFGSRSLNTYILDGKKYKGFKDYILSLSFKFGKMLGYQYDNYKLSQSWLTWKSPGQQHIKHSHANSLISGVFYYGTFNKDTPSIDFHKNESNSSLTLSPSQESNKDYTFSSLNFTLKAGPGMVILFPSNLIHSVPINNTRFTRKSLSFNIIPQEGFGVENNLTELKFKI